MTATTTGAPRITAANQVCRRCGVTYAPVNPPDGGECIACDLIQHVGGQRPPSVAELTDRLRRLGEIQDGLLAMAEACWDADIPEFDALWTAVEGRAETLRARLLRVAAPGGAA